MSPVQQVAEKPFSESEYATYIDVLRQVRNTPTSSSSATNNWDKFNLLIPTATCPGGKLRRYPPGIDDGGKFICNLDSFPKSCVVYSIGSHGEFDFESMVQRHTQCEIHSFDCTGDYGPYAPRGVNFHPWCVDSKDHGSFYTIQTMMDKLSHRRIHFLKLDAEGAEHRAIPVLLSLPHNRLPLQIALEVHIGRKFPVRTVTETIDFLFVFHSMGYRLLSRDDNPLCTRCSEFLFILTTDGQVDEF